MFGPLSLNLKFKKETGEDHTALVESVEGRDYDSDLLLNIWGNTQEQIQDTTAAQWDIVRKAFNQKIDSEYKFDALCASLSTRDNLSLLELYELIEAVDNIPYTTMQPYKGFSEMQTYGLNCLTQDALDSIDAEINVKEFAEYVGEHLSSTKLFYKDGVLDMADDVQLNSCHSWDQAAESQQGSSESQQGETEIGVIMNATTQPLNFLVADCNQATEIKEKYSEREIYAADWCLTDSPWKTRSVYNWPEMMETEHAYWASIEQLAIDVKKNHPDVDVDDFLDTLSGDVDNSLDGTTGLGVAQVFQAWPALAQDEKVVKDLVWTEHALSRMCVLKSADECNSETETKDMPYGISWRSTYDVPTDLSELIKQYYNEHSEFQAHTSLVDYCLNPALRNQHHEDYPTEDGVEI